MRIEAAETGEQEENVLVSWKRILSEYYRSLPRSFFAGLRAGGEAISWLIQEWTFENAASSVEGFKVMENTVPK
jgi:hypothetical protein